MLCRCASAGWWSDGDRRNSEVVVARLELEVEVGRLRWWSRQTGCRHRTSRTGTVGNVEPGVRWLCGCQPGAGGSVGDPRWRPSCCPTRRRTQSCSAASVSQPSPRRPTNLPKRPAACPAGRRAAPPHDSGATADARARTRPPLLRRAPAPLAPHLSRARPGRASAVMSSGFDSSAVVL